MKNVHLMNRKIHLRSICDSEMLHVSTKFEIEFQSDSQDKSATLEKAMISLNTKLETSVFCLLCGPRLSNPHAISFAKNCFSVA